MNVSEIRFNEIQGPTAHCILVSGHQSIALQCRSKLPDDATPLQHRTAWVNDAIRQQSKMPEFRNTGQTIEVCPNAWTSIANTAA